MCAYLQPNATKFASKIVQVCYYCTQSMFQSAAESGWSTYAELGLTNNEFKKLNHSSTGETSGLFVPHCRDVDILDYRDIINRMIGLDNSYYCYQVTAYKLNDTK